MMHGAIATARRYSDRKLSELRELVATTVPEGAVVVACGSFARREACAASDLDYFAIARDAAVAEDPTWAPGPSRRLEGHRPGRSRPWWPVLSCRAAARHGQEPRRPGRHQPTPDAAHAVPARRRAPERAAGFPCRAPRSPRPLHRPARRPGHAAALPAERPDPLLPHDRGRLRIQDRGGRQALGPAQPEARVLTETALRERAVRAGRDVRRAGGRQRSHGWRNCSRCRRSIASRRSAASSRSGRCSTATTISLHNSPVPACVVTSNG